MVEKSRRFALGLAGAAVVAGLAGTGPGGAARAQGTARPKPLVLGHRGAPALRPEHTLASYAKAIADGADYIEPDLVPTKDGVLVARHENDITGTTDVARRPEFAARKTTKTVDGESHTGWFTEDFTLAELKTLRAIERLGAVRPDSQRYDGQFQVPTLEEVIDFTAAEAAARGRVIGLIPELKHSTYFAKIGLPLEDRFLAVLQAHDYTRRNPVEIQSFEIANLRYLRGKLGRPANIRLLQLTDEPAVIPADVAATGGRTTFADMLTADGLKEIATYADAVGPWTRTIIPLEANGRLGQPNKVVDDAHAAGLLVRTYTFRPENRFLAADYRSEAGENARNETGAMAELKRYLALGIDGFFIDDPALGRKAVDAA
ncbi:glycerophosphodiester phosphodiesterase [Phreatobacter sp. AB_2022a]|uniref:glycerophosphodiester phosphodiesterase n=1 Tax=Phreatobacter sp. AB_2022a TaxID=3003134 RepID=UPI002286DE93|nr:glycerophosphodiester phosphodiesterase [Phreatobacter sp. AB_2022a]MCZ0738726.1 glycerophosphodiester phosphodiesterase [Phreatobacter sp. AB_2022a]